MPAYRLNRRVEQVATPPIADVQSWIAGRRFAEERPLLDVSQAVPSYPPAEALREHLADELQAGRGSLYTDILGIPALREALAAHLSDDYQGEVDATQIAITAGCNQAFTLVVDALCAAGDEVVLPVPFYFNHDMWLRMRAIEPVYVPKRDGTLRVEDVERAIGERTRAIVIVSPDNPTGTEYPAALLETLAGVARERGVALVVDETYKDFRSDPAPPHGIFQGAGWDGHFVHLFSFSKAYAVTGYRVGAIAAHPSLLDSVEKLLDCETICATHLSQRAALFALEHLSTWKQAKANVMRERVTVLRECFKSNALRYELLASGAYFAYVRHPFDTSDATTVARRLADEQNVLCLPGSMFGPEQDRCLRFAFANLEADDIPVLVERLVASQ